MRGFKHALNGALWRMKSKDIFATIGIVTDAYATLPVQEGCRRCT